MRIGIFFVSAFAAAALILYFLSGTLGMTATIFLLLAVFALFGWLIYLDLRAVKEAVTAAEAKKMSEERLKLAEQRKQEREEAFESMLRQRGVEGDYVRLYIFGMEFYAYQKPQLRNVPAVLWKGQDSFMLLPLEEHQLPVILDKKECGTIAVKCKEYYDASGLVPAQVKESCAYSGPYQEYFRSVSKERTYVRNRNHPNYQKYFHRGGDDMYSDRQQETTRLNEYMRNMENSGIKPKPILYYYGEYSFCGYIISLEAANMIHKKWGIAFRGVDTEAVGSLGIDRMYEFSQRNKRAIDVGKAMLNDGVIAQSEYEKIRTDYLCKIARNPSYEFRRNELVELASLGLISDSEALAYLTGSALTQD